MTDKSTQDLLRDLARAKVVFQQRALLAVLAYQEANLAALTREFPDRAAWWEQMEDLAGSLTTGSGASFSKRYTRAGMREFIERQGDLIDRNPEMFFGEAGMLCQKEDGECTG